jgi:metallo-beta-lactamase class B
MTFSSRFARSCVLLTSGALLLGLSTIVVAQGPRPFSRDWYAQFSGAYSEPVQPFRIVGNIYYVGARNIASYLITTPQGHILIDSGMTEMHDGIISGIEQLGFKVSDVHILLASHAHFDHVEGHALMQRRTGAQVMAMAPDADALESGHDTSALGGMGWEPVHVSRRLKDGDTVTLGGTTLRAIHAPGHTQGATIWMTTVEEDGRRYNVAFFTTTTPNVEVPLDNPRHKNVIEDTRNTFRKLKAEHEPDIVLVGHPQAMFAGTMERMRKGERPHPLLNGADAWTRQLATSEAAFERRVSQERSRR